MTWGSSFAIACFAGAFLCLPSSALADEQAAAEALFRSAREAAERADWATACERFEESHRLEPAPGTILNLAKCREELGQIASAWKRYGEVVQKLPKGDPRAAYAEERERELDPQVPRLVLRDPGACKKCQVRAGDIAVTQAMFGVPLPFDPGEVKVEIRLPGRALVSHSVRLVLGEVTELVIEPGAEEAADPTEESSESPAKDRSGGSAWTWLGFGAGASGAALATVGFTWAASEATVVNNPSNCTDDGCNQIGYDASQRGQVAVVLGWVGVGLGAVGLSVGTISLLGGDGKGQVNAVVRPNGSGGGLYLEGKL